MSAQVNAIVRGLPEAFPDCRLTFHQREAIDMAKAQAQHRAYVNTLKELGAEVQELPSLHDLPDSVFVEDCAVVMDEAALLTRPGASSRADEVDHMIPAIRALRPEAGRIQAPGTLDGGDVLCLGKRLFVGASGRTNAEGFAQLAAWAGDYGYTATRVPVDGCLHLKSGVTALGDDAVLINRSWVDPAPFQRFFLLDAVEPGGANALRVGERLMYSRCFPETARLLKAEFRPVLVDNSEILKAEGALTCCSIIAT